MRLPKSEKRPSFGPPVGPRIWVEFPKTAQLFSTFGRKLSRASFECAGKRILFLHPPSMVLQKRRRLSLPVATAASILLQPDFHLEGAQVATTGRDQKMLDKKDDERQASTALDLVLGESDRFSQTIGAGDGHVRTTDDNAPYRNGRSGIVRELQSPSPSVPRSA